MGISNIKGSFGPVNALADKATFLFTTSSDSTNPHRYDYAFTPGWYGFTTTPIGPSDQTVYFYFVNETDEIVGYEVSPIDGASDGVFYLENAAAAVIIRGAAAGTVISCLSWDIDTKPSLALTGAQPYPWALISNTTYPGGKLQSYNGELLCYSGASGLRALSGVGDSATATAFGTTTGFNTQSARPYAFVTDGTDVILAAYGGAQDLYYSIDDGATWTDFSDADARIWTSGIRDSAAYGGGLFVALRNSGSTTCFSNASAATIISTGASISWTTNTALASTFTPYGVVYGGGRFVSYGYSGTDTATGTTLNSTDGVAWTSVNLPAGFYPRATSHSQSTYLSGFGHFIIGYETATGTYDIMTSTDGTSWAKSSAANPVIAATSPHLNYSQTSYTSLSSAGGSLFLCLYDATRGGYFMFWSADGIFWDNVSTAPLPEAIYDVGYNGTNFFFVTNHNSNNAASGVYGSSAADFSEV